MGRIKVQGQLRQTVQGNPFLKITRAKWTGVVAQAVVHLLHKDEALSSNPSFTQTHTHTIFLKKLCSLCLLCWGERKAFSRRENKMPKEQK
jgi:hypothetical protein